MESEYIQQLFQKYIDKEITQQEWLVLRKAAEKDESLKEELMLERRLRDHAAQKIISDLETTYKLQELEIPEPKEEEKQLIKQIDQEKKTKPFIIKKIFPYLKYAAIFILGILGYFYFFSSSQQKKSPHLNAQYIFESNQDEYAYLNNDRTTSETETKEEAFKEYNLSHWLTAEELFNQHLKDNPNDFEASFFLGRTYLQLDQIDIAIQTFLQITKETNSENFKHYYQLHYDLALCFVKKNEFKKAIEPLLIAQKNRYYKEKASRVLDQINSLKK